MIPLYENWSDQIQRRTIYQAVRKELRKHLPDTTDKEIQINSLSYQIWLTDTIGEAVELGNKIIDNLKINQPCQNQ